MVGNVTKASSKYFEWIKGTFKFEKLVGNLHDKTDNVIHIRNLKQALESWISFKKGS